MCVRRLRSMGTRFLPVVVLMFGDDETFAFRKRNRRRRLVAVVPSTDTFSTTGSNECKSTTSTIPSSGIVAYWLAICGADDTVLLLSIPPAPAVLILDSLIVLAVKVVGFLDVR